MTTIEMAQTKDQISHFLEGSANVGESMTATLVQKFNSLPPDQQKQVLDFVEFLYSQMSEKSLKKLSSNREIKPGSAKGLLTLSDEFDVVFGASELLPSKLVDLLLEKAEELSQVTNEFTQIINKVKSER